MRSERNSASPRPGQLEVLPAGFPAPTGEPLLRGVTQAVPPRCPLRAHLTFSIPALRPRRRQWNPDLTAAPSALGSLRHPLPAGAQPHWPEVALRRPGGPAPLPPSTRPGRPCSPSRPPSARPRGSAPLPPSTRRARSPPGRPPPHRPASLQAHPAVPLSLKHTHPLTAMWTAGKRIRRAHVSLQLRAVETQGLRGEERAFLRVKTPAGQPCTQKPPFTCPAQSTALALPLAHQHPAHSGFPQDAFHTFVLISTRQGHLSTSPHAPGQAAVFSPSYFHKSSTLHCPKNFTKRGSQSCLLFAQTGGCIKPSVSKKEPTAMLFNRFVIISLMATFTIIKKLILKSLRCPE